MAGCHPRPLHPSLCTGSSESMPAPHPVIAASPTSNENVLSGVLLCPTRKPPGLHHARGKCVLGPHAYELVKCARTRPAESRLPVCLADLFLSHLAKT